MPDRRLASPAADRSRGCPIPAQREQDRDGEDVQRRAAGRHERRVLREEAAPGQHLQDAMESAGLVARTADPANLGCTKWG